MEKAASSDIDLYVAEPSGLIEDGIIALNNSADEFEP
jgi:hypothetical protein